MGEALRERLKPSKNLPLRPMIQHFVRALQFPVCFTTKQSAVKASLLQFDYETDSLDVEPLGLLCTVRTSTNVQYIRKTTHTIHV